jgi:hypothetical protein
MNFIKRKILRSNFIRFSKKLSELFLDDNDVWLEVGSIRKAWHYLVVVIFTQFFFTNVLFNLILTSANNAVHVLFIIRIINLSFIVIALGIMLFLLYTHYKYLLITGKDLRFKSIAFYFVFIFIAFGALYYRIYVLNPSLYLCPASFYVPLSDIAVSGVKAFLLGYDFILYAFSVALSLNYPRISSDSTLISTLNILQTMIGLIIVSLFIATFVQKSDRK